MAIRLPGFEWSDSVTLPLRPTLFKKEGDDDDDDSDDYGDDHSATTAAAAVAVAAAAASYSTETAGGTRLAVHGSLPTPATKASPGQDKQQQRKRHLQRWRKHLRRSGRSEWRVCGVGARQAEKKPVNMELALRDRQGALLRVNAEVAFSACGLRRVRSCSFYIFLYLCCRFVYIGLFRYEIHGRERLATRVLV